MLQGYLLPSRYVARIQQYRTILLIIAALALWSVLLYVIPPSTFTDVIGLENSYSVSFLVAVLAGFSSFTGAASYATVIEFSRAGADPLFLGLASGIGLFISDSVFYLLMMRGRDSLQTAWGHWLDRINHFFKRIPSPFVYLFSYLFCALGPIPNDVTIAALVVAGYTYRSFWPVILAGDVTFMLFLSYLFH